MPSNSAICSGNALVAIPRPFGRRLRLKKRSDCYSHDGDSYRLSLCMPLPKDKWFLLEEHREDLPRVLV